MTTTTTSPRTRVRRATTMSDSSASWLHRRSASLRPDAADAQHKRAMSADRPPASRPRPLSLLSSGGGVRSPIAAGTSRPRVGDVAARVSGRNRLREVEEQTGEPLPRLVTRSSSFKRASERWERSETWSRTRRSLSPGMTSESPEDVDSVCSCSLHPHHRGISADSAGRTSARRPAYADAAVQTIAEENEPAELLATKSHTEREGRARDVNQSHGPGNSHGEAQIRGYGSETVFLNEHSLQHQEGPGLMTSMVHNPIMMGRMQDYFRSGAYTLGQALS